MEDSKVQKIANERILARAGYTVVCAMDGEQAVSMAQEKLPDLILLDLLLPKVGGIEVLGLLRGKPETAKIPVIVLSTLPQANEEKLKVAGAAAYFEKSRLVDDKHGEAAFLQLLECTLRAGAERHAAAAG